MARRFEYAQAEEVRDAFGRHGVRYLFIESFDAAWRRRVEVEGFPACHPDDIIASKEAANRLKDRESLPRLRVPRLLEARKPIGPADPRPYDRSRIATRSESSA